MYQFFVEDEQIANDLVIIEGSDVNHIRNVLRMKCGEKVRISSTSGRNFFGTIDRIAENVVEVCIMEETALDTELPCRICLFQGLPKSDKMELIIQKAVELGATREVMERIAPGQSVGIFIGPEGGFDPSEIALAKEEGMHLVSLGKRILRTETAGLATLSILMYHIESVSEAEEERDQP